VIHDLIDRVMTDPRLNKNPAVDEAHHRISPAGFKFLVTEMLCSAGRGRSSTSSPTASSSAIADLDLW
jgi:hemoglobin